MIFSSQERIFGQQTLPRDYYLRNRAMAVTPIMTPIVEACFLFGTGDWDFDR